MSREEQIKWLRRLLKLREDPKGDTEIDVALKCAIEALEQEPCEDCISREYVIKLLENTKRTRKEITNRIYEVPSVIPHPCEDAISRQAVIDINEHYCGEMPGYVNHEIWKEIKALQSVTPQPKMGRWIEHFDEICKWYECDQCHTDWGGSVNYCPNCGAKM